MKKTFLWVTDPWETLDHERDTSLRLAQESLLLGFKNYWCDVKSVRLEEGEIRLEAAELVSIAHPQGELRTFRPDAFQSIQYRVDPPIDLAYLHPLQLLRIAVEGARRTQIVNPPDILFGANEKFEALPLGALMPPSLVSSRWERLAGFGKQEGRTVLKPLFQAQSLGIELLDWRTADSMAHAKLKLQEATDRFSRPVLLQRYLEGIREGEQRLWFLDGKLLAFARKLPLAGDFRVNLDRGSQVVASRLSAAEKRAVPKIGKRLKDRGIRLAAVDLIEAHVTDLNFTSPGLIIQMEAVLGLNLARPIIEALIQ